jgi:hypothetical protein
MTFACGARGRAFFFGFASERRLICLIYSTRHRAERFCPYSRRRLNPWQVRISSWKHRPTTKNSWGIAFGRRIGHSIAKWPAPYALSPNGTGGCQADRPRGLGSAIASSRSTPVANAVRYSSLLAFNLSIRIVAPLRSSPRYRKLCAAVERRG